MTYGGLKHRELMSIAFAFLREDYMSCEVICQMESWIQVVTELYSSIFQDYEYVEHRSIVIDLSPER